MPAAKSIEAPPMHKPPGAFTACRWFFFCATVSVNVLVLLHAQLRRYLRRTVHG
jgi:hypothetical protein